ncbi:MAG: molecular chaperone HtpG [Burkholderiales bacterium]|nr:molecular chaperone HtpG [Burkholderiales bacterium]
MSKKSTHHTHSFQAEVAQLLHLVTHSLYSNPEIFLRELVSNASDACDKLRFEGLNQAELYENDPNLRIQITFDKTAKTLTITDNGIGLTEADAIEHLGTIAKSGTKEFMSKLTGEQKTDAQLIGQFGVGFYSGFIVADKITVESRRAGAPTTEAVRWVSNGTGAFTTEAISREARGTSVILHLRDEFEQYLNAWEIKQLIRKYSDHISLPIEMKKEVWQDAKEENQPGEMVTTNEWETVNSASALWTRPKKDITDEQYQEFYKHISHDFKEPLAWAHNRVEGATEYTQLLFIPAQAPHDLYYREHKSGLKLYVKRVFIMDDAEQLLPQYLRFVKGVIDSSDLPLNVSRELLQESRDVKAIREGNTRRILSTLESLANSDDAAEQEKYAKFYAEFGAVLKEGLAEDAGNADKIAKLLRYASTSSDTQTRSLVQYKADMKDGQEAIYYLTAENFTTAKNSPQLEVFRKKGIEVLLMTDRIDEWALNYLTEFDGTPLRSVTKGAVDLGKLQDEEEKKALDEANEQMKPLIEKLQEVLKDSAKSVRITTRLVDSPACLVVDEHELSPQMIKMFKQMGQDVPEPKPILEINPEHALVKRLDKNESEFADLAHVIFDQAKIADGQIPADPAGYLKRVNALLLG